ncbi:MAG: G5 domain-containing protein, partial [Armatimonadetes bacterium]|nr:G5 domain-containing protein [Armatimonadota bacterium]
MRRFAYWAVALPTALLITTVSAIQFNQGKKITTRTEVEKIPYEVKFVFKRGMRRGALKKVQYGIKGEIRSKYRTVVRDGKVVQDTLVSKHTIEPTNAVFQMGKPSSRGIINGTYTRAKVLTMESTAYTPDAGRTHPTFITYTGTKAEYGAIAVDPKVIPLGTLMYVEGYGFGKAEDTGSAIKGNIIDVCIEDLSDALRWGRRDVKVHIFL